MIFIRKTCEKQDYRTDILDMNQQLRIYIQGLLNQHTKTCILNVHQFYPVQKSNKHTKSQEYK